MRRVCIKQEKLRVRQKLLDGTEKSKNELVLSKSPEAVQVPEKFSPEKKSSYSSRIPRYPIPSRSVISIASNTRSQKPNSKYHKFCHNAIMKLNKKFFLLRSICIFESYQNESVPSDLIEKSSLHVSDSASNGKSELSRKLIRFICIKF